VSRKLHHFFKIDCIVLPPTKRTGVTQTVHLAYVRERVGHALIGARQWIPAEHLADADTAAGMGIADGLAFRTKGQLAIDIRTDAYADGVAFDFARGDEVYGSCTQLRQFFEEQQQAYVLRVASSFMLTLNPQTRMTCAQAVALLATDKPRWQIRPAGAGSKGQRWYAWAWIATVSPRHYLLVRRHLKNGDLAYHYCYVPQGQPLTLARLVRAAGLRWPVDVSHPWCTRSRVGLSSRVASFGRGLSRWLGPASAGVIALRAGPAFA